MAAIILPVEGTVSLSQVAAAIANAESTLGAPPIASLRIVGVRIPDQSLVAYAASLQIGVGRPVQVRAIEAGDVFLIEDSVEAHSLPDADALSRFVQGWRRFAGVGGVPGALQDAVQISRHPSDGGAQLFPHWKFNLYEMGNTHAHEQVRRGPVANRDAKFFAPSIPAAAATWLGERSFAQQWSISHGIPAVFQDTRAALNQVTSEGHELFATVIARVPGDFYLSVCFDESTSAASSHVPVSEGRASVAIPSGARAYTAYLLGPGDVALDERSGMTAHGQRAQSVTAATKRALFQRYPPAGLLGGLQSAVPRPSFIEPTRLGELRAIESADFDLGRLVQLCEEINSCYDSECWVAVIAVTRALIDHVPPIFGEQSFTAVANNYTAARSTKTILQRLDDTARKFGDLYLHQQIAPRAAAVKATKAQVNFSPELDLLLGEIVRLLQPRK